MSARITERSGTRRRGRGGRRADRGDGGELDAPGQVALPGGVVQVASAQETSFAVLAGGTVAAWGDNSWASIGDGTTTQRDSPVIVPGLTGITQVSSFRGHTLALDSGGRVWAWGYNHYGQLGNGSTANSDVPRQVPGLSGVSKIAVTAAAAFAIRAGGSVLAWGDNSLGQLGNGTAGGMSATPVPVPGLTGVTQISGSQYGTLAVVGPNGALWGWGLNYYGELGDGTLTSRFSPEQTGLTGVTQVSAGQFVTAAVLSSGAVMTWGANVNGELGTGTRDTANHPTPVLVRTLAGVSQVAAGDDHVLAVGSPAPRIPSVIGFTQQEAAQALQAAGYVLGRVATVVDITCEFLGEVKTQSPAAGTIDPPGTPVSVTIGKAGGKCL